VPHEVSVADRERDASSAPVTYSIRFAPVRGNGECVPLPPSVPVLSSPVEERVVASASARPCGRHVPGADPAAAGWWHGHHTSRPWVSLGSLSRRLHSPCLRLLFRARSVPHKSFHSCLLQFAWVVRVVVRTERSSTVTLCHNLRTTTRVSQCYVHLV
jgi:hypothetical protein